MVDESLGILLIEVYNDLGIGVGIEAMSQFLQLGGEFHIVEYLAIEDHLHRLILIVDRLIAPCQIDDTEAGVGQSDSVMTVVAITVGTAVMDGMNHPLEFVFGGWNTVFEI
jgi:hypothetical protein